jgi:hypothetical protein
MGIGLRSLRVNASRGLGSKSRDKTFYVWIKNILPICELAGNSSTKRICETVDYIRVCRKSLERAFYQLSCLIKSSSYTWQNDNKLRTLEFFDSLSLNSHFPLRELGTRWRGRSKKGRVWIKVCKFHANPIRLQIIKREVRFYCTEPSVGYS